MIFKLLKKKFFQNSSKILMILKNR